MRKSGWLVAAAAAAAAVIALRDPGTATPASIEPVFLPTSEFRPFGASNATNAAMMSDEDTTRLEKAVATMHAFDPYLYGGCADRAHAAYLLLPPDLRAKVSKIWIIGPSAYTSSISGTIKLRAGDRDSQAVNWGHHVALLVETPQGSRIFDPAFYPGELISREKWFKMLVIPRFAIWLISSPEVYVFNYATMNSKADHGSQVWMGDTSHYEWLEPKFQRMPQNLARDAIGLDATRGTACKQLSDIKMDPQRLSTFLDAGEGPSECAPSIAKYKRLSLEWKARLAS